MRLRRLLPLLLALAGPLAAADAAALLRQAQEVEDRCDAAAALELYRRADAERPNDAFILQKIAKQYSDASEDVPDPAERQRMLAAALDYSQRAVALQPKSAVNVLSLAICYGKLASLVDTHTRLHYSRLVKQYADEAVALDPNYDYAHHVLGRWHYEVATLGFGTRFIVRLVYGGLPAASTAEAVRELQRATELAPADPAHRVELGLALIAHGQRDAGRQALEHALTLSSKFGKYDELAFARARAALAKLP